jgi:ribosome-associated protein
VTSTLDQTLKRLAEAAVEKKARDLVGLNVHQLTSFTDAFLLATGTSDRHVRSYDEGRWVLIDLNDVVIHVFQEEVREYYDLERLWGDAPPIELGQPPEGPFERETAR